MNSRSRDDDLSSFTASRASLSPGMKRMTDICWCHGVRYTSASAMMPNIPSDPTNRSTRSMSSPNLGPVASLTFVLHLYDGMSKEYSSLPAGNVMRLPSARISPRVTSIPCPSARTMSSLLTQSRVGPYLYVPGPEELHAMLPPMDPSSSVGSTG